VGPYATVNCTLTLQSSSIRKSSLLKNRRYGRQGVDDDRFIDYFGSVEQIVTSGANNDSGLFETNLRDERFLPFEGSGAVNSTWKLQLPAAFPPFDYATISDAILHLRYTARQAGDPMADQATTELKQTLRTAEESSLALLFMLRSDFPTEWAAFAKSTVPTPNFTFRVRKDYFPYFVQNKTLAITSMLLYGIEKTGGQMILVPANSKPTLPPMSDLNTGRYYVDVTLPANNVLTTSAKQVYLIVQYTAT